ncbi:MAG: hypothetical protein ACI4PG_06565 [Candidatus Ventricola sp.]
MTDYMHGVLAEIATAGTKAAAKSRSAIIYVGTAPVHTVSGGAERVNKPILIENMARARALLGYSDEWDKYTLCEAMYAHFALNASGPMVMINVLDPEKHKKLQAGSASLKPENGRVTIASAQDIVLGSVSIEGKTLGTDYTVSYNPDKQVLTISEGTPGALGDTALSITYDLIDAEAVKDEDVIGNSDGAGLNTGLYAVRNVYQETGYVPAHLLCPGFGSGQDVHDAMVSIARKISGHWDAYVRADIPIVDEDGEAVTLKTAAAWKKEHGFNQPNETVYFPMASGTDGRKYHLSVLAAANLLGLLQEQDGIPYQTASNTPCPVIRSLYMGEAQEGRVVDDSVINDLLGKNGIASAAFVGGRWAIWGAHSADYGQESADAINVSETNRMMLYYIANDFQHRRPKDVDRQMTANAMRTILSEEQQRLDALCRIGALTYGEVRLSEEANTLDDMVSGDYAFAFNITTTPICKSLRAVVNWTEDGYAVYYDELM